MLGASVDTEHAPADRPQRGYYPAACRGGAATVD